MSANFNRWTFLGGVYYCKLKLSPLIFILNAREIVWIHFENTSFKSSPRRRENLWHAFSNCRKFLAGIETRMCSVNCGGFTWHWVEKGQKGSKTRTLFIKCLNVEIVLKKHLENWIYDVWEKFKIYVMKFENLWNENHL